MIAIHKPEAQMNGPLAGMALESEARLLAQAASVGQDCAITHPPLLVRRWRSGRIVWEGRPDDSQSLHGHSLQYARREVMAPENS